VEEEQERLKKKFPERAQRDVLLFLLDHAPMEPWEFDILSIVREEAYYFAPQGQTKIMNEGWASYWHARLLREADFLPQPLYLAAIKAHSDVVRPYAAGQETALAINPYHLGFTLWEHIIDTHGLARAREVMHDEDDFGFIRNFLDRELAEKLDLFVYEANAGDEIKVANREVSAIREAILAPKFNYGAPRVAITEMHTDGSLVLVHEHASDGRGLDVNRAKRVLDYTKRVWRRPVRLHTVNERAEPAELTA
jgi:stage V sporulation protein R